MQLFDLLGSTAAPAGWMDLAPGQDPGLYFAVVALALLVFFAPVSVLLLGMYGRGRGARHQAAEPAMPAMLLVLPPATGQAHTTYPSAPAMIHAQPQPPAAPWYTQRVATMESAAPVVPTPAPLSSLQVIFDDSQPELAIQGDRAVPALASAQASPARLPPQQPPRYLPELDFDMKPTCMSDRPLPPVSDTRPDLSDLAFDQTVAATPDQIPQSRAPLPSRALPPAGPPPSRRPTIRPMAASAPRTPPPPKPPSLWGGPVGVIDPNDTAQLTPVTPVAGPIGPRSTRISGR